MRALSHAWNSNYKYKKHVLVTRQFLVKESAFFKNFEKIIAKISKKYYTNTITFSEFKKNSIFLN